jgi:hypothetical protein
MNKAITESKELDEQISDDLLLLPTAPSKLHRSQAGHTFCTTPGCTEYSIGLAWCAKHCQGTISNRFVSGCVICCNIQLSEESKAEIAEFRATRIEHNRRELKKILPEYIAELCLPGRLRHSQIRNNH